MSLCVAVLGDIPLAVVRTESYELYCTNYESLFSYLAPRDVTISDEHRNFAIQAL